MTNTKYLLIAVLGMALAASSCKKEPETAERLICGCGKQGIKGIDVWQPFAPYHDTVICKACWDKFIDWQKQQSK